MDEDESGVTVNVVYLEPSFWGGIPQPPTERREIYTDVADIYRGNGWLVLVHGEDLDTTSINLKDIHRIEVR